MDAFEELLSKVAQELASEPEVMTFRDIGDAALRGAAIGNQTSIGPMVGAMGGVAYEASKRVLNIGARLQSQLLKKPSQPCPKPPGL